MRTALNQQIEGLTAEHNRKLQEIEFSFAERRLKTEADLISSHLSYVKEGSQEEYDWTLKSLDNQFAAELLAIRKAEQNTPTQKRALRRPQHSFRGGKQLAGRTVPAKQPAWRQALVGDT